MKSVMTSAMRGLQQGASRGLRGVKQPPPVPQKHTAEEAALKPDLSLILENNKHWVDGVNKANPDFFPELGKGQSPRYLYIGCSDSRVDPGRLLGLGPGDLFVHRNVGNLCPNDLNFLSVLEYAVRFLKVPHIIVCGHYDCGAVANAEKVQDIGLLENWIRQIRDVHRLYDAELTAIECPDKRRRRMVELNVIEQCRNVMKTGCVQRHRLRTKDGAEGYPFATPQVHGLVFDPADGILKKLDVNFDEEIAKTEHIYKLYNEGDPLPPPIA